MDFAVFTALATACAPLVPLQTAAAVVATESAFNPWAIGVVGGALLRQPGTRAEAYATARALQASGWTFSVGLGQINVRNLDRLGLSLESAFDPCRNLAALQTVLADCFDRAASAPSEATAQTALRQALSCYYSGNFSTGFRHGYVRKVVAAARLAPPLPPKETACAPSH